jgi:DNA-binding MarR family transcriptional regulator
MANTAPIKKQKPIAADDVSSDVIRLVDGFLGLVWSHFFARIAEFGLSAPEAKALKFLAADKPVTMRELAARLHSNPSNVTVVVGKLEARGLVHRTGAEDRRIRGVQLTGDGLELAKKLKARLAADHPAVSRLSPAQREAFRKILRQIVEG